MTEGTDLHRARKKWRKQGAGYAFGSVRRAKDGERTAGLVPMYGPSRGWHAFGHTGSDPDPSVDLGTFDEDQYGSEAEALTMAKDFAQSWVQTGKKPIRHRRDNPANVGGASSGALQARGRQGNPEERRGRGRHALQTRIRDLTAEIKQEQEGLYKAYRWDEGDFPDDKMLSNVYRDNDNLQELIDHLEKRLAKIRAYGPEKRLKNPGRYVHGGQIIEGDDWNLDAKSPQELINFANKIKLKEADLGKKTTGQLVTYCKVKARAIRLREAGHINDALELERQCDRIHSKLPKWAKW